MANRYDTNNAVGSADPRDLFDNSIVIDEFANSESETAIDRLGQTRRTIVGLRADVAVAIGDAGYTGTGANGAVENYAAGIEITQYNQVVRDTDGEFWKVTGATALPYTTTGAGLPEGGTFVIVGDFALRQDLADPAQGGGLVSVTTSTGAQTLVDALDNRAGLVSSLGDLKALAISNLGNSPSVRIVSTGRAGLFRWVSGDQSANVTGDPQEAIWVAPTEASTGASGAWQRQYGQSVSTSPTIHAGWFGVDAATADNAPGINAADALASSFGGNEIKLPAGTLRFTTEIYLNSNNKLTGTGAGTLIQGNNAAVNVSGIDAGEHVTHWQMSNVYVERIGTTAGPAVLLSGDGTTGQNKGQIRFDITNLWIKGSTGNGLVMRNTYIGNVYNPILRGCAGTGFAIQLDIIAGVVGANAINVYGGEFQSNNIGAEVGSCAGIFFYGTIIEGNSSGGLDLKGNVRQFAHIGGYYEGNGAWDARIGSEAPGGFSHSFRDVVFFDGSKNKPHAILGIRSLNCTIDTCGFIGYTDAPISNQPAAAGGFKATTPRCYTDSSQLIDNEDRHCHRPPDETRLTGTTTWDAGSINNGSSSSTSFSLPGVQPGDFCFAATASNLQGLSLTAYCASAGSVVLLLQNNTGGAVDLANTTYRVVAYPKAVMF